MSFADRLDRAVAKLENPCVLGIDPHLDLLPPELAVARDPDAPRSERARALAAFGRELCELARGKVAAVKVQSAFFEALGSDGALAWEDVIAHAHACGLLVIGDVKRGDIGSTSSAYASAFLGSPDARTPDAITVHPYLGADGLEPFVEACGRFGKGLFVLVRTSNPGGALVQLHGDPPLAEVVADLVDRLGERLIGECGLSSVGAVVGATHGGELGRLRARMPRATILLPGVGAQGATVEDARAAFAFPGDPLRGALIPVSRSVAFAWREEGDGARWREAAGAALERLIAQTREALVARPG